jgi:hypothetical protein
MMKSKAILVSLVAIFAVLALMTFASASDLNVNNLRLSIKGDDFANFANDDISLSAGETVPVKVVFDSWENASDVKVKIELSTHREDISASTERFKILDGRTYSKLLSLRLPEDFDPVEGVVLTVTIEGKVDGNTRIFEYRQDLTVQRESYKLDVLSVDTVKSTTAGSTIPVNVVLKNRGAERLDDTFVTVRIASLGVEKKVYFGDLIETDTCNDCNQQDATERTMYIQIPSDAKAGVYNLEVEAYNSDSDATTSTSIVVGGSEQKSDVLAAVTNKEVKAGETVTYDLVIINSGDKIAVYDIVPETAQNLIVSVDEPIVTVPADSSRTVQIKVTAGDVMGTFNFGVSVNSQDQLVKKVNFSATVAKKAVANNVMILTVILAIIFVVLLIVLIVLLTKKPEKTEEFGESYY